MSGTVDTTSRSKGLTVGADFGPTPVANMPVVTSDRAVAVMQSTPRATIEQQQRDNFAKRNATVLEKCVETAVETMMKGEPPTEGLQKISISKPTLEGRENIPEVRAGLEKAFNAIGFDLVGYKVEYYNVELTLRARPDAKADTAGKPLLSTTIGATQQATYDAAIAAALETAMAHVVSTLNSAEPAATHTVSVSHTSTNQRGKDPHFEARVIESCKALGYPHVTTKQEYYELKVTLSTEPPAPPVVKRPWWKFWA